MASKNELPVISLAKIYWQEFLEDLRQMYLIMNLKKVICDTFLLYCPILCFFLLAPKTPGRCFFLLFLIFARTFFDKFWLGLQSCDIFPGFITK